MTDDTKRHDNLTLGRAQAHIGDAPYAVTMRIDGTRSHHDRESVNRLNTE